MSLTVLAVSVFGLTACSTGEGDTGDSAGDLPVVEVRVDGGAVRAEVAATPAERATGLSGRDDLDADAGMLFDLGETRVPAFWMKDVRFPLDFIWIDADRRIAEITRDVPVDAGEGGQFHMYSPSQPVRWVLELNGGAALTLALDVGDVLEW